ncbi:putative serpin-Z5 [Miscanthus floridulus]|uniref:putative serpin-Z5 n=1 Tax=Miscanthus floridulus TaxID=154761 RepID=UPI00345904BA
MNEYNWKLYDSLPRFYMSVFLPDGKKGLRNMVEKIASPRRSCTTTYPRNRKKANMGDFLLEEDKRRVHVNRVIHKAVIEMNEEGSEAAAVAVESDDDMGYLMFDDYPPPPKPVNFVADHLFAFFIVEETSGAVVFAGHVVDPSKEE